MDQVQTVKPTGVDKIRYQTYSPEDEVLTYIAYQLEGHNASAASKATGVPADTIRRWVVRWNREGFEPGESAYVDKTVKGFIGKATKIRDMALARMEQAIPETKNVAQLMIVVDKLNAQVRLASGQATSIVENREIDVAEITSVLAKYLEDTASSTIERHNIVVDVDFEEQVLGLENTPETKE